MDTGSVAPSIHCGNAAREGAEFRHWFVGDLSAWSSGARDFGLRDTTALALKWGLHPAGETRPGGWAEPDGLITLSVLVAGDFLLSFEGREARLREPGDYALWGPAVRHTWTAQAASTVLTVRWKPSPVEAPTLQPSR